MSARKEELEFQLRTVSAELNEIKEAETEAANQALLGKCFKTRNNYSCPEKPSDYWWLYVKVTEIDGAALKCLRFQIDKGGRIDIEPGAFYASWGLNGYTEIKPAEFNKALSKTMSAANEALHS
jgi:hypothetical protein